MTTLSNKFLESYESHNLVVTDKQDNMQLYTYKYCENKSDDYVKKLRSVVVNNETKEIVSVSFPFTLELNETNLCSNVDDYHYMYSYEGTVVRLFYFNDKWNVSTMRKLNAYKSRWGSNQSFGQHFENIMNAKTANKLNDWYDTLNKDFTYTFILTSTSHNRIVCLPHDEKLVFTGSFDKEGNYHYNMNEPMYFESPKYKQYSKEELEQHLFNIDIKKYQGLFGYSIKTNTFIKLYNSNYLNAKLLRGNEPDLRKRYLQTLHDDDLHRRFRENFSDHSRLFRRLDGSVHSLVKDMLNNVYNENDYELSVYLRSVSFIPKNHKQVFNYLRKTNFNLLIPSIFYRLRRNKNVVEQVNDNTQ